MNEFVRLLLLLALAGTVVTFLGSAAIWFMDEERRMRRALRRVLKGTPEAAIFARGRGRAAGFNFATGQAVVAWDVGAWCLIYRIDELMGAELIVDGQVVGRAFRGEVRRAVDQVRGAAEQVTLRLIFDDPRHPDFGLDLWLPGDDLRRVPVTSAKAVQEANRWLARAEAILRRPAAHAARHEPPPAAVGAAPAPSHQPLAPQPVASEPLTLQQEVAPQPRPLPAAAPAPAPPRQAGLFDDPPWDDDVPDPDEAYT
jgi:hypothetical protein